MIRIFIKVLSEKSSEHHVCLNPKDSGAQLKRIISCETGVPVAKQRLMFGGKMIADTASLESCLVKDGSKVYVILNKEDAEVPPRSQSEEQLIAQLRIFLRPHFTESDSQEIIKHFRKDLGEQVDKLSLDDIERLATYKLNPAEASSSK